MQKKKLFVNHHKYRDDIQDEYDRGANEMLEEVIDDIRKYIEEVNADDSN